jgi:hypothetical protein
MPRNFIVNAAAAPGVAASKARYATVDEALRGGGPLRIHSNTMEDIENTEFRDPDRPDWEHDQRRKFGCDFIVLLPSGRVPLLP